VWAILPSPPIAFPRHVMLHFITFHYTLYPTPLPDVLAGYGTTFWSWCPLSRQPSSSPHTTLKRHGRLTWWVIVAKRLSMRCSVVRSCLYIYIYAYLYQSTHIIYIYYIRHTLIVRGLEATCSMYQGVGRQCASSIWLPHSARVVLVRGVNFCWYDAMMLSPLNWFVVWAS